MKVKKYLITVLLICGAITNSSAWAILGNSQEENNDLYGLPKDSPVYHSKGNKDVSVYKDENRVITVVYRNNKSILENVTYLKPVKESLAKADIEKYILPDKEESPLFTSTMDFAEGFFKEYIYKSGVKAKIIFNEHGNVTDIVTSIDSAREISRYNES